MHKESLRLASSPDSRAEARLRRQTISYKEKILEAAVITADRQNFVNFVILFYRDTVLSFQLIFSQFSANGKLIGRCKTGVIPADVECGSVI